MSARVNPFADLTEPPVFMTKPKPKKQVEKEVIARIAQEHNFPSRQPAKAPKEPRLKRRVYRTGRDRQINIKATADTVERFYKLADSKRLPLGALLELALSALERDRTTAPEQGAVPGVAKVSSRN
jgi:hypothetical protein